MRNFSRNQWSGWTIVAAGMLAALVVLGVRAGSDGFASMAGANDPKAPKPTIAPSEVTVVANSRDDVPALPRALSWLDKDGKVEMPVFHDRHLPEDVLSQYPWINPRWAPFNRCLRDAGYGVGGPITTQEQANQTLDSINAEGPFTDRDERGSLVLVETPGLAVFLDCAYILELDGSDVTPLLQPGDPRGDMPVIP